MVYRMRILERIEIAYSFLILNTTNLVFIKIHLFRNSDYICFFTTTFRSTKTLDFSSVTYTTQNS